MNRKEADFFFFKKIIIIYMILLGKLNETKKYFKIK